MAELCPHRKPHIRRICNEKNSSGTITDIYIYLISILIRNESHFNPGHISVFVLFFFFFTFNVPCIQNEHPSVSAQ